ncbi:transcriptional activator protein LasR [Trinickia caryophylli]|uniref:Transcriptional regulator, LuxR family n=2 Tax=Trinickia caryophylli TaxID=28094 RepID=A0A1X7CXS1_TRICW|nr:transcriptional activator protein LasR [Trinickia caryophylli]SMF04973.1 transcriptional regulator, LuxR family [Trinickia caryophylli]
MPRQFIEPMSPLWRATDEKTWFRALSALGSRLGFDQTLFAVVPRPGMPYSDVYLRSDYPSGWRQAYDEHAFVHIDPTVAHCTTQVSPFVWSSASFIDRRQKEMYEEARHHGLSAGIALPIHGPKQEVGMLCFVSGERSRRELKSQAQRHLSTLTLLRDVAFDTARHFIADHAQSLIPRLTPREYECLKWTAQGKSTWEIARIFGCSEATVNFHMTNIRAKFGVSSRSAAAVKATRMGLIDPD